MSMLNVALRAQRGGFTLDAAFTAPAAGTTMLFGPSGAGKSSLLLAIAGLLRAQGRVAIGETVLQDETSFLPPERRRLGVVFQDARLFPHLCVDANLRYGLRRAPQGPIGFNDVVDVLGIGHLLARRPAHLSGGERQRVAIGRALLSQPHMLLLDEPLASLDAARKAEILPYLARLKASFGLPMLYVTHALDEVTRLGDHLVLIDAGRITAAGDIAGITARADLALAARDDAGSVLAAFVRAHHPERGLSLLELGDHLLWVPLVRSPPGSALRLRIPAREVILARGTPGETSVHNTIPGHIRTVVVDASRHTALVQVDLGPSLLLARVTSDAVDRLAFAPGASVVVMIKSVSVEVQE